MTRSTFLALVTLLFVLAPGTIRADPFHALDVFRPGRPTPAKPFTVAALPTGSLTLAQFNGRVVFLNFWATWCPPCKEEMPSMERLYQRYRERGLTIIAIAIDSQPSVVGPFVQRLKLTFPIGLDPKLDVANLYGIRALPSTFLIDRAGSTVAVALGPRDWDSAAAHSAMEQLLK